MFADFHTHILHEIDDGPKTLTESITLLEDVVRNGCDRVVVTPHFDGSQHGLEDRVALAQRRLAALKEAIGNREIPLQDICLGYEVRYFDGISRSEEIGRLCLNQSRVLLLELDPFSLGERTVREITELHYNGYTILLAHVERYVKCSGFKWIKRLLQENLAIPQINAASLVDSSLRHAAYRLLKEHRTAVLSSDAHSVDQRPSFMRQAFEAVQLRMGAETVHRLQKNGDALFAQISSS